MHSYIENNDCEVVYGDSVPGDEPILVCDQDNRQRVVQIQHLAQEFNEYPQFCYSGAKESAVAYGLKVWAGNAWVPIRRVIRHMTQKPIYRVHTDTSFVDVTADHSLINKEGTAIPPLSAMGQVLLETHPATNKFLKVDWPLFVQRC